MTFVLAYGNLDLVGQVSDRRLTGSDRVPRVLPENKATVVTLADSRLICGFAGLARAGHFRTGAWLLDALSSASSQTHLAHDTVERFTQLATERFQEDDLAALENAEKACSFLFTGYRDVPGDRGPIIAALVTNFQNFESGEDEPPWAAFRATYWSVREGELAPTWIQRIGQWPAMSPEHERRLREALEARRSPATLDAMTVGIVREVAAHPMSDNTVGRELSSVQIGPERPPELDGGMFPMVGAFHPEGASHVYRGVNQVISVNDELQLAIRDPEISVADRRPENAMVVRKVGRNKPCPCGSGQKYKRCHGA